MSNATRPLDGLGVLVTRPAKQAQGFAQRLKAEGAVPVVMPTIEIAPPLETEVLKNTLRHLAEYDFVMFVSVNAVEQALMEMKCWPSRVMALAPGLGTAAALREAGVPPSHVLVPESRFDSEGLLALPQLQDVRERRILILRGESGRELLGNTLEARGAEVTRLACYRRLCPAGDAAHLLPLLKENRLHAITAAASEALDNLCRMAGESLCVQLKAIPAFVTYARIAAYAQAQGWQAIDTGKAGPGSGDEDLICGMMAYFLSARDPSRHFPRR